MKRVIVANRPASPCLASLGQQLRWALDGTMDPIMHHSLTSSGGDNIHLAAGDYAAVYVRSAGASTLYAEPLARTSLQEFVKIFGSTLPAKRWHGVSRLHSNHQRQQNVWANSAGMAADNEQAMTSRTHDMQL